MSGFKSHARSWPFCNFLVPNGLVYSRCVSSYGVGGLLGCVARVDSGQIGCVLLLSKRPGL